VVAYVLGGITHYVDIFYLALSRDIGFLCGCSFLYCVVYRASNNTELERKYNKLLSLTLKHRFNKARQDEHHQKVGVS